MLESTSYKKIFHALQVAIAMCFIGHGAFGIITKAIWCNYFAVLGIGHDLAYKLMPVLGTLDILFGITMLFYPNRAIALWLVCWGIITASLRPLSGEPFAELIERAGNFGAPLALLILTGFPKNFKDLFTRLKPVQPDVATSARLAMCLRIVVFFLLIGHGWLNIIEKKGLISQYTSIGFSNPGETAHIAGMIEIISAFIILIKPIRQFLFVVLIWKMITELFYPHYEIFEWIERGGSYCSILALILITGKTSFYKWTDNKLAIK